MAKCLATTFLKHNLVNHQPDQIFQVHKRLICLSPILQKVVAGKVKITPKKNKPVTYEASLSPPHIGHRKSWNSWNTTTIKGGLRKAETAVDDMFIRKFINGTFSGMVMSEVIIKRQHNIIRIAFILLPRISTPSLLFIMGYTEELLSHWFHCIVKLELQTITNPDEIIFKYV